jgi:hypothetical protein
MRAATPQDVVVAPTCGLSGLSRFPRHSEDDRRSELTKLTFRNAGRYVRVTIQARQGHYVSSGSKAASSPNPRRQSSAAAVRSKSSGYGPFSRSVNSSISASTRLITALTSGSRPGFASPISRALRVKTKRDTCERHQRGRQQVLGLPLVVLPPILDGLDDSLAAQPDLIVWMKSRAAEDVLLMSRKHPQRTRHEGDDGSCSTHTVPRHLGAGCAAEHTVDRVRRLRRRCGHSALRLAVLFEPRISVVHQPHWFPEQKVPNGRRR